jgi:25S rRNA (uracil2634-N3)-methyltransferase
MHSSQTFLAPKTIQMKRKLKTTLKQSQLQASKKASIAIPNPISLKKKKKGPSKIQRIDFQQQDRILLVGEGNFSFAASISEQLLGNATIIATTYDSRDIALEKYSDCQGFIDAVVELGGQVHYDVDAARLQHYKMFRHVRFDKIVFNFPHVGMGIKDMDRNIRANQELLVKFFGSCAALLSATTVESTSDYKNDDDSDGETMTIKDRKHGQVIVTLKCGEPYDLWDLKALARAQGFACERSFEFNTACYPGYSHRHTIGHDDSKPRPVITEKAARTYVFKLIDTDR